MDKIVKLTHQVRKWNTMGHSLLPQLELVIISNLTTSPHAMKIVEEFSGIQMAINSQKDPALQPYRLFMLKTNVYGRLHLLLGLTDTEIKDHQFRERKKHIEKFIKNKDTVFIVFSEQDKNTLLRSQQYLSVFGYATNTPRIILVSSPNDIGSLHKQILTTYESIFKYDLVANYRMMRTLKKEVVSGSERYLEWKKVLEGDQDTVTFSLLCFKSYVDAMSSSFSGTYSAANHFQKLGLGKSIHWKVMELLHEFWEVQGDILFKTVDAFNLSFIEQQYKISDYYSIGGFLPDTCFKAIFSPPLYRLRDALIDVLENIKQNVLHHVELALSYIFKHTNIEEKFISREVEAIQKICQNFQLQMEKTFESQIQFIHANPEDFWNYRQLNSSLYSPQQQVYIEIKYIGKAYVKRVYESIKDSVPRYIGQGLLKQVVGYLSQQAFTHFVQVVKEDPFKIDIPQSEIVRYEQDLTKVKELQNLIGFFSMKVSGTFLVKNFHEKKQLEWERMFGKPRPQIKPEENYAVERAEREDSKGIIRWMKNIFKSKRAAGSGRVRSSSVEKQSIIREEQVAEERPQMAEHNPQKQSPIDEKHWLLIINIGKEVSNEKIHFSACEGFPPRFRSSIWMYLATRSPNYKNIKLSTILQTGQPNEATVLQINKDVHRTSPQNIFRFSLKESLKRVLLGYSLYDPEISYTQGMNFITAITLLTLTNYGQKSNPLFDQKTHLEEIQQKSFTILRFLMQQKGIRKLMFVSADLMADLSMRLDDLIKSLSPLMGSLIDDSPFGTQMLFSSPLLSCLSNVTTNVHLLQRFTDLIISNDFLIVYKVIGHFVANCQFMADKMNMENMFDILKNQIYDEVFKMVGDQGLTRIFHSM